MLGNAKFINLVKEISKLLQDRTQRLVLIKGKEELKAVEAEIKKLSDIYGPPAYVTVRDHVDVEFPETNVLCRGKAPSEMIEYFDAFDRAKERFHIMVAPNQWVMKIDKVLLRDYAEKFGMEHAGILSSSEENKRVLDSFIYETASFILARMLLIRFSEDHHFLERYVSNGGITVIDPSSGEAEHLGTDDPLTTNICFGGQDHRTAFITCSGTGRLISTHWPRPGLRLQFEG